MIKKTSYVAYQELKKEGKELSQKTKIFLYIKENPNVSRTQIAKALNLGINAVTGRVNLLLNQGYLEVAEISPCPITGKKVEKLRVSNYSIKKAEK
jgi:predicted transcriptional regulator